MQWDLSCPDWEARLRQGRSLVPDLPLNQKAAADAAEAFGWLRLPDVPGEPTLADAAGPWFHDIVRALFGSLDPETGERHIRELLVLVPKKNSKTSYGALLMLVALLLNKRPRAKFILCGPTQDVAELAFGQIRGAIDLDPVLSRKLHIREHLKKIVHRVSGAELEVMTFDPSVLTGQKPAGILIDELHVSAKMPKAASALRQLRGGMLAIPESFMVFITTQSEEAPVGVFKAELTKARAIRDGRQPGAMLPILYEFPQSIQRDRTAWREIKNWPMVTPNAGRSITIERLAEEYRTAESTGDDELRAWASQHLNIEIGVSLQSDGWAGAAVWTRGDGGPRTLAELIDRSECVTVGVDGGGLDDLFGFGVIGRERETRRWLAWGHALIGPEGLQRRKANETVYRDFIADGDLTLVDGLPDDLAWIVDRVALIKDSGLLAMVGADPAGIGGLVDELAGIDVTEDAKLLTGVPQGIRLMNASKTVERKLADGTLKHSGSRLLAWCAGNAKVRQTSTAVLIERAASGYGKIDPLMAIFNAAHLMGFNPQAQGNSVYETRGISII